ncbi:MAG: hypothetical protein KAR79_05220 [Simkaniaceae bacterium]|nr:hypothetical protein [Simkaniaceae bacterium]
MSITMLPLELQMHIIEYAGNPRISQTCRSLHAAYEEHCRALVAQFRNSPEPSYFLWQREANLSRGPNTCKIHRIFHELISQHRSYFPDRPVESNPPCISMRGYHAINQSFLEQIARDRVSMLRALPGGEAYFQGHGAQNLDIFQQAELLTPFMDANREELSSLRLLRLSDRNMHFLPPEIGRLKGLDLLDLYQNECRDLPQELSQLERRSRVSVNGDHAYFNTQFFRFHKLDPLEKRMLIKSNYSYGSKHSLFPGTGHDFMAACHSVQKASEGYKSMPTDLKNDVHHEIWRLAGEQGINRDGDENWGETHLFDDLNRLTSALTNVLERKLQQLEQPQRNHVSGEIYRLHSESLGSAPDSYRLDSNWGYNHRADDLKVFAEALKSVLGEL